MRIDDVMRASEGRDVIQSGGSYLNKNILLVWLKQMNLSHNLACLKKFLKNKQPSFSQLQDKMGEKMKQQKANKRC